MTKVQNRAPKWFLGIKSSIKAKPRAIAPGADSADEALELARMIFRERTERRIRNILKPESFSEESPNLVTILGAKETEVRFVIVKATTRRHAWAIFNEGPHV